MKTEHVPEQLKNIWNIECSVTTFTKKSFYSTAGIEHGVFLQIF